jgi:molybdopterin/thiamine biosynthesis adenylyltransferase/rhodanese-related sulfurtransferase
MTLSPEQTIRYSRHLIMPEIGEDGQSKLLAAKVLLVGAGGLGSPAALYLAAAGVGTLGVADFDVVDITNLHRQVLHSEDMVGRSKLDSARKRLNSLNSDVKVVTHETRLVADNALEILRDYDIVIDGSDNFATRYLVNDACVLLRKPNVYGSVQSFEGQASVFVPREGPCYRCLFPEPPPPGSVPSCAEAGILGILPGIVGLIQATECLKLILGKGRTLCGRLLLYDAMQMEFRSVRVRRSPDCPVCGEHPTITRLIDYEGFCSGAIGSGFAVISARDLREKLERGDDFVLVDVRNRDEYARANIPGSRLIPLPELAGRLDELADAREREVIVHCQSGARSAQACAILRQAGFEKVANVSGGIVEWQRQALAAASTD